MLKLTKGHYQGSALQPHTLTHGTFYGTFYILGKNHHQKCRGQVFTKFQINNKTKGFFSICNNFFFACFREKIHRGPPKILILMNLQNQIKI